MAEQPVQRKQYRSIEAPAPRTEARSTSGTADHTDDDWEAPSEGLIVGLMTRHGCSRAEAWRRLGVDPSRSPVATTFRSLPEGSVFLYRSYECAKHRPTVLSNGKRVPDRDYDYDLRLDRKQRRPNAQITAPLGPRRIGWLYVHPDALIDPVDVPPRKKKR